MQDTLLKAMRNAEKYTDGTNFKGWIKTIAKNLFLDEYKRAKVIKTKYTDKTIEIEDKSVGLHMAFIQDDINKAMVALTVKERFIATMYYSGKDADFIASETNGKPEPIRRAIQAIQRKMRVELKHYRNG